MTGAIIGALIGFIAGMVVSMFFPLVFYVRRLQWWLMGPVPFKIGDETVLLGPDDHIEWDFRGSSDERNADE